MIDTPTMRREFRDVKNGQRFRRLAGTTVWVKEVGARRSASNARTLYPPALQACCTRHLFRGNAIVVLVEDGT